MRARLASGGYLRAFELAGASGFGAASAKGETAVAMA